MTPDKLIEYCEDSGIAIENLEASKSSLPDQPTGKSKLIYGLQAVMNEFRDNFIHPDDGERYNSFSSPPLWRNSTVILFFVNVNCNKKTAPSGAENMVERRGFEPLTS